MPTCKQIQDAHAFTVRRQDALREQVRDIELLLQRTNDVDDAIRLNREKGILFEKVIKRHMTCETLRRALKKKLKTKKRELQVVRLLKGDRT